MKKVKIFTLPSHATKERTSGVDFARVIQPMSHLNGYNDGEVEFEVYIYDAIRDEKMDWGWVAKNFDIIYFNYTANPWGFAAMGSQARHYGKKMVMDMDDSLWNVMPDNPSYKVYQKGSQALTDLTAIVNEVDHITTTNLYLKNVITHNTKKKHDEITLFPNYIDLDLYKHRSSFKDDGNIKLLHFGSTTHFIDLENKEFAKGIDMIMKEYPNVTFTTVGGTIPQFRYKWGARYNSSYGHQDIYKWIETKFPKFMDEADILVTPLEENIYTRCKSYIKFLEGSSAKKPGVWQAIRQYSEVVKDGENGFIAHDAKDWFNAIKKLIEDPKLRKSIGESAFATVEKDHQIKDHVKEYADFFKKMLDIK